MFNLSKALLVSSLFSMPLFAVNASSGGEVGPSLSSSKSMSTNSGGAYYAMRTPKDTLDVVFVSGNNSVKQSAIQLTKINGVYEFPRSADVTFVPYKVVNIQGYYPNPTQIEQVAAEIANDNNAYAFYINSVEENTQGSHTQLQISLYKQNAELYYNSALYHVSSGKTIRELTVLSNNDMNPIGTLKFNNSYPLNYELTREAAKQAIAKNASAFYITSINENTQGTNKTVYVSYYK